MKKMRRMAIPSVLIVFLVSPVLLPAVSHEEMPTEVTLTLKLPSYTVEKDREGFDRIQMEDFTSSRAFRVSGKQAFEEAGITHGDVDHLMIYDAFAHLPIYGLEDLGFVKPGEAGAFIAEGNTRPGGKLPLNTNGGVMGLESAISNA